MEPCEQMWELISAGLDDALTPDEQRRLDDHLAQCPDCRALASQLGQMQPELMELSAPAPGFADRVLKSAAQTEQEIPFTNLPQNRNVARESRKQVNAWWKPMRTVGAIAACCLLILGAGKLAANSGLFAAGRSAPAAYSENATADTATEAAPEDTVTQGSEAADTGGDALVLDGRLFRPGAETDTLPAGFTSAGALTDWQAGDTGLTDCPYFASPDEENTVYVQTGEQTWLAFTAE